MRELVADLTAAVLQAEFNQLAIFGHSMGAVIAAEVCQCLEQNGAKVDLLIVSGHSGPAGSRSEAGARAPVASQHTLMPDASDHLLLSSVCSLDDWTVAQLEDPEFRQLFLSMLRADMQLLAGYPGLGNIRVDAPVTAIGGQDDPLLRDRGLSAWQQLTRGGCTTHLLSGGHFYLKDQGSAISEILARKIDLAGPARTPGWPGPAHSLCPGELAADG
jgi:pyochelin biosynthesis protein PchC